MKGVKYVDNTSEIYRSFADLPLGLKVTDVSKILSISRAGAYNLVNSEGFPSI